MKKQIEFLLHNTLAEVESMRNQGMISERLFRSWKEIWSWSVPRFGGIPGMKHDSFWNRFGQAAYYRRMNKTREAFGFTPCNEMKTLS